MSAMTIYRIEARRASRIRSTRKKKIDTRTTCEGFTLVELLVAISIIALLIAILLPVLTKAREVTQQAVCMSNMRQIGLGMFIYMNDHDGVFLPNGPSLGGFYTIPGNRLNLTQFHLKIAPLLNENEEVFTCPSVVQRFNPSFIDEGVSYNVNFNVCGIQWDTIDRPGSSVIALYETDIRPWDDSVAGMSGEISGITSGVHGQKKANYLAVDGHVKTLDVGSNAAVPAGDEMVLVLD